MEPCEAINFRHCARHESSQHFNASLTSSWSPEIHARTAGYLHFGLFCPFKLFNWCKRLIQCIAPSKQSFPDQWRRYQHAHQSQKCCTANYNRHEMERMDCANLIMLIDSSTCQNTPSSIQFERCAGALEWTELVGGCANQIATNRTRNVNRIWLWDSTCQRFVVDFSECAV